VTRLPAFPEPFNLVLDIGCFHGLSPTGKTCYMRQLKDLLIPGGIWMMYGFFKPEISAGPGLVLEDVARSMEFLELLRRQDGWDRKERPSAWFWFKMKGTEVSNSENPIT
jgi:hypothetical protein